MKLMHEKNHEFARVMNFEIMKCEDPLYNIHICSEGSEPLNGILVSIPCRNYKILTF